MFFAYVTCFPLSVHRDRCRLIAVIIATNMGEAHKISSCIVSKSRSSSKSVLVHFLHDSQYVTVKSNGYILDIFFCSYDLFNATTYKHQIPIINTIHKKNANHSRKGIRSPFYIQGLIDVQTLKIQPSILKPCHIYRRK